MKPFQQVRLRSLVAAIIIVIFHTFFTPVAIVVEAVFIGWVIVYWLPNNWTQIREVFKKK